MKCLGVTSYLDGYNTKHLPYEDLTYATLAGFHGGRDFYQSYCFICACMRNWGGFHDDVFWSDYGCRTYILEKLGLTLRAHQVNEEGGGLSGNRRKFRKRNIAVYAGKRQNRIL